MGLYPGRKGAYITATEVGTESSPTYTGLTLSGLTASTLVYSNASKAITSLANGTGALFNNGSGTLTYAAAIKADGTQALTADWNVGAFDLTAVDVTGTGTVTGNNVTATPTLGAELITNFAGWTDVADWAYGSSVWHHDATGTTPLVSDWQPTAALKYKIVVVNAVTTAGSGITMTVGGQSYTLTTSSASNTDTVYLTAIATAALTFVPATDFHGDIVSVSVKAETNGALTATTGTFTNGMTVNSGQSLFPNGTCDSKPSIASSTAPGTGISFHGALVNSINFSTSYYSPTLIATISDVTYTGIMLWQAAHPYRWATTTALYSDANYQLDLRYAANPNVFNVYGTYTSATNYERGFLRTTAAAVEVGTEKGSGGGTARPLNFYTDGVLREQIDTSGNISHLGANSQATNVKQATAVVTTTAAATATATNLIPAGSMVVGVSCRNLLAVTGDAGFTGYSVGDGSDVDRWGANVNPAINETTDLTDCTITSVPIYATAASVVLTQVGGSTFVADKTVRVTVHYISITAPST